MLNPMAKSVEQSPGTNPRKYSKYSQNGPKMEMLYFPTGVVDF